MREFTATITKAGINPCVEVPARISTALGAGGYMPVRGTINGQAFRSGLVPLGGGRHRLFINGQMRKTAAVDVGDTIRVAVEQDPAPRRPPMPAQLSRALDANEEARQAWEKLAPSRRKEILSYLGSLKRPESLRRNVDKVIRMLLGNS